MQNMQNMNPSWGVIYLLIAFLACMGAWTYTRDNTMFTLAATMGGALAGAVHGNTRQNTNVENVEKATVIDNKTQ